MSGIPLEPVYGPPDVERPGVFPYTRGPYASMYRSRLWTMRMFAGYGTPTETNVALPRAPPVGRHRALDRVRSAHADGPRLRRSRRRGRGGEVRRRRRHARRHDRSVRRHRSRRRDDVDDDQLARGRAARDVHRGGGGRRRRARPARRHPAERHLEGVPGAEGVRVPAAPVDAARARHDRVLHRGDAAVAPDLDLRVPHPRGRLDGRTGARVHAGQRVRVRRARARRGARRRSVRAAPQLLLQRAHRLLRGDRQVPRGAAHLGAVDGRPLRRDDATLARHAVPHADRGRVADGAAARGQHRAHRDRGAGGRARRHAVAPHQLDGRGARAPDRASGAHRAPHATGHRARDRASRTSRIRSAGLGSSRS